MFFKKKKKNNSVLGIDFSPEEVRIVELEKVDGDGEHFRILNFIIKTLPKGVNYSDNLNSGILGQFMKELISDQKLTGKKAISAVSGTSIISKELEYGADFSEREIESMIRNSRQTHHQKGIENLAFDFYEIKEKRTKENKYYNLKMCPIEAITTREDVLNLSELDSIIIDVDDNAIEKISPAFDFQYKEETGFTLEDDSILLIDVRRSKIIVRTLTKGIVSGTEEKAFSIKLKDTEEVVLNRNIEKEIKKRVLLESTTTEQNIKAIFLMGDNEKLIKIKKFLEEESEVITHDMDVFISNPLINIQYAGVNPAEIIDAAPSLVMACGLAMRDVSKYE